MDQNGGPPYKAVPYIPPSAASMANHNGINPSPPPHPRSFIPSHPADNGPGHTEPPQQPQIPQHSQVEQAIPVRKHRNRKRPKADLSFQSINSYLRLAYLFVVVLVFAVGGWAYFTKIEGAVIVTGKVEVDGKPKTVQHLDGGVISEIMVSEGDFVQEGESLLTLDSTILSANVIAAESKYFENEALISRLLTEKAGGTRINWLPSVKRDRSNPRAQLAIAGQEQLFQARHRAFEGHIELLNSEINKLRIEDNGLNSQISSTRREFDLVNAEHTKYNQLLSQGLVSRGRVVDLQRDKNRLESDLAKLGSLRDNIAASISQQDDEIQQLYRSRQEDILTELRDARKRAGSHYEALNTSLSKKKSILVKAPSSGIVHDLEFTTVGGVITPGQSILQVVPQRDKLVIGGRLKPDDIDQVFIGQNARVVFSTLDQDKSAEFSGIVEFISADVLVEENTGESYFAINVVVLETERTKLNGITLSPGMPASIYVQTNPRSVMNYVFAPIRNALDKTMKDGT